MGRKSLESALLSEQANDFAVVSRDVRICAVLAVLDRFAVLFEHSKLSRAVIEMIQRTITEQAVYVLVALMARIELTILICEESCIIHSCQKGRFFLTPF